MTLQEFLAKYNGQYVEEAGTTALNQCVDLANRYIREVLGFPIIEWTNAKDFPSKGGNNYDYILNTPTGVPQAGDLVIWGGTYGHIAIFIEGDANRFTSFDENYPTGSPAHVQEHNYSNVIGWMHPKQSSDALTACLTQHTVLVNLCNQKDETIKQLETANQTDQDKIKDLEGKVTELTDANTKLKQNVKECSDQIASMADEIKKTREADSTALDEGLTAETSLKALQGDMTQLYSAIGIPSTATLTDALRAVDDLKTHNEQTVKEYQKLYDLFFSAGVEISKKLPKTTSLLRKIINLVKGVSK